MQFLVKILKVRLKDTTVIQLSTQLSFIVTFVVSLLRPLVKSHEIWGETRCARDFLK